MAVHQTEELSFAATGDAILTRRLAPYEGNSPRFDGMLDLLREPDVTATNLEVLVHDYDNYPAAASGGTYMRAPPVVLDELDRVGCDLFSAATNHAFDFSHGGIETTLAELRHRDLPAAGLGHSLYEARKPAYLETPAGRVAMVSTCTSITPGSEAGEQSAALPGRPGINPQHVEQVYRVPAEAIEELREVSEVAGIEAMKESWLERGLYNNHDWNDPEFFHFGDMKFDTDTGESGVEFRLNEDDFEANMQTVAEARANADFVIAAIHSHQGVGGRETTTTTPDFIRRFARTAIDAGADAVVGHGPHVLRGVELYDGKPVFYSLGNWIVQNETVERLPPESFARYGIDDDTRVSEVFDARLYDDGVPSGDLANEEFWMTVVPVCTFRERELDEIELYPITLQREAGRPQRGIPVLATGPEANAILERVAERSTEFGTDVTIEDEVGRITL